MAARLRTSLLALAVLASAAGCGVMDELDKGRADMEKRSPSANKEKAAAAAAQDASATAGAASAASGAASQARQAAATWWQNARSLGSEETSEDVVRCVIKGADQYMHKPDCLMRGGTVAKRTQ